MTRVKVEPEFQCYFVYRGEAGEELRAPVSDISSSGLALLASEAPTAPIARAEKGTRFEGQLLLRGEQRPVELVVVHNSGSVVGCAYSAPHEEASRLVSRYLRVELATYSLVRIDPKYVKKLPEGQLICFRGPDSNELRLVAQDGRLLSYTLLFFDWQIEGKPGGPVSFGTVARENQIEGIHYDPAEHHAKVPSATLDLALYIVSLIQGLEDTLREQLRDALNSARA